MACCRSTTALQQRRQPSLDSPDCSPECTRLYNFTTIMDVLYNINLGKDAVMARLEFQARRSVEQVEEGRELAPKFGPDGLMPCITTDARTGEVLMLGWMNVEALRLTIETADAHYFSRSRQMLWRKGSTSGLVQRVVEARIDDDQDSIWLRVEVGGSGASCHVGYRSCFYRTVPVGRDAGRSLTFVEEEKTFDPNNVYGDAPNPTKL